MIAKRVSASGRREFLVSAGSGVLAAAATSWQGLAGQAGSASPSLRWRRGTASRLFDQVECEGRPLVRSGAAGLLNCECRHVCKGGQATAAVSTTSNPSGRTGPVCTTLTHRLHISGAGRGEDLLEGIITLHNESDQPQNVEVAFLTSAQPADDPADQHIYIPVSAAGLNRDPRLAALGSKRFVTDGNQHVGRKDFQCHYLEPMASHPTQTETAALLLAPVVDIFHVESAWRVALFTPSEQPMRFATTTAEDRHPVWRVGRHVTVPAGKTVEQRCWLYVHQGDASVAWKAFQRFAHHEPFEPVEWLQKFKVHYYDFLSSAYGKNGRRGDGYEADLQHFRAFHVGLATQHGYYPVLGDYLHPDRKTWKAMSGDKQGPAEMSLEKMRARIKATRAAGARAAVYIHSTLLDDAAPLFDEFRDSVLVDPAGKMVPFPWQGPDTIGKNWRASIASPQWRGHLLEQTRWIMELLDPDAIVVDETFAGIGYDHHPDRAGPMAVYAIDLYRKMRQIVKSSGRDRVLMTSDCSMTGFALWADGECGDHAYPTLLGNPLYRQEPVRYLAALGERAWRPCSWHFRHMWDLQMQLARQVGAGVGVSNGWIEYTGLAGLTNQQRRGLIADIESLPNV
ncbi:MAG: hypothetical protein JXM70_21995 [Pirellulales bacterium]|nr:hypothetical protein [Pirellulales bacterium]